MKAVIGFVMIMYGSTLADLAGTCNMAAFYMELGCSPAPRANNSACPDAFTCPDFHPDPTMCYYRGVPYEDLSTIQQSLIKNPCTQACSCQFSNGPQFECASVDCFETVDSDFDKEECIVTSDLDSCCNVGKVCGKDEIAKLKTCEVDGKIYREGQYFEPLNTMKTCVCSAKWNGSVDNPESCRDVDCGIEIHNQGNLLKRCAPVFAGSSRSCPIAFECPSPTSKVIRGLNVRDASFQCQFMNMTLSLGDEVTVDDKCTKCSCDVAPFVTCIRQNTCN